MYRKNLSRQVIMEAAISLVEARGYDNFSLRELAAQLEVKPSSLYNHINGVEEINLFVAMTAADRLHHYLERAVTGKPSDDAFLAAAHTYRRFATEHPELYKALIRMPLSDDSKVVHAAYASFAPLRQVIQSYNLDDGQTIHFVRGLRAMIHGFVELSASGFMQRGPVSADESYEVILQSCLKTLKGLAKHE